MGWFKHQLDLSFLASWNALASVVLRKPSGNPCISPGSGQALCLCFSMERFRLGMDGSQVTVDCDPDPRYIRIHGIFELASKANHYLMFSKIFF